MTTKKEPVIVDEERIIVGSKKWGAAPASSGISEEG